MSNILTLIELHMNNSRNMWPLAFHENRHEIIFIQLSLWNDIFTWEQGMDETKF